MSEPTREEVLAELRSLIRQSEDAAKVNEAGAAAHREEYEQICAAQSEVNRARLLELYTWIIEYPRQARRLRKEANIYRRAIELIEAGSTK